MAKRVDLEESTVTTYKCTNCGALDSDRGESGRAPSILQCHACGLGRGKSLTDQMSTAAGMVPIDPNELPVAREHAGIH